MMLCGLGSDFCEKQQNGKSWCGASSGAPTHFGAAFMDHGLEFAQAML